VGEDVATQGWGRSFSRVKKKNAEKKPEKKSLERREQCSLPAKEEKGVRDALVKEKKNQTYQHR